MEEIIANKCIELRKAIHNHPAYIRLDELDRKMSNDEQVMKLAYKKDVALEQYNDALNHFGENNEITIKARQKLYDAKKELDLNPIVKQYNEAYKEVRLILYNLNEVLFNDFKEKC